MSRLCWVFVLLVVVFVVASSADARPHQCVQKGRSLANLELVEDALRKAKQVYLNCGEGYENSNCSESSRKDKSFGYIDVALDLVSIDKKNIHICVHVPTKEPSTTTERPSTTTERPSTTTEKPSTTTEIPMPEVTTEGIRPMDCQDLQAAGHVKSGVYTVWPLLGKAVQVRCDMYTDGGGWTVIQSRGNFVQQESFDRDWLDYKNGFGNLERDSWLGNDHIFSISNQGNYSLRMDMTSWDFKIAYALYRVFRIEDEKSNYKLHVGGYSGNAGDDMSSINSRMFSTRDRKNNIGSTRNCAEERKGGFWYYDCAWCNPNGLYKPGVDDDTSMNYRRLKEDVGLFSMEMKIKRL